MRVVITTKKEMCAAGDAMKTYFPILIRILTAEGSEEYVVCKQPKDVPAGVQVFVVACNIRILG